MRTLEYFILDKPKSRINLGEPMQHLNNFKNPAKIFKGEFQLTPHEETPLIQLLFFDIFKKIPSSYEVQLNSDVEAEIFWDFAREYFAELGGELSLLKEFFLVEDSESDLSRYSKFFIFENPEYLIEVARYNAKSKDLCVHILSSEPLNEFSQDLAVKICKHRTTQSKKDEVSFIKRWGNGSFTLDTHEISKFDLNIDKHYNDDLKKVDEDIRNWIQAKNIINNRLVLLSGEPGTGKTNYIRNLISFVNDTDSEIIYVPPSQTSLILDSGFMGFISNYKNSVLVIEDAEEILLSRSDSNMYNSFVNLMLNLTDGILASVMDFKVICTFNTSEDKIDEALMRKGRLFKKYKFEKLSEEKTLNLYQELYAENPPEKEMTISDIYERENNGTPKKEERLVGFSM